MRYLINVTVIIMLMLSCAITLRAIKPAHHPRPAASRSRTAARTAAVPRIVYDTVRTATVDSVQVAGYEKLLRATRESMFVTNKSTQPVTAIGLDISYHDMQGRQLHRRSCEVNEVIPAGETRMIDIPSFDRQGLFYYHLSPLPQRASQATPFEVEVEVKYVCYPTIEQ